jgi:hypothetical protein
MNRAKRLQCGGTKCITYFRVCPYSDGDGWQGQISVVSRPRNQKISSEYSSLRPPPGGLKSFLAIQHAAAESRGFPDLPIACREFRATRAQHTRCKALCSRQNVAFRGPRMGATTTVPLFFAHRSSPPLRFNLPQRASHRTVPRLSGRGLIATFFPISLPIHRPGNRT